MTKLHIPLFLSALVTLSACNGSNDEELVVNDELNIEIVSPEVPLEEGMARAISINTNTTAPYTVAWVQESGPKSYFTVEDDGTLNLVTPNINEATSIEFSAVVIKDNQQSNKSTVRFDITNREFSALTSAPKPNVFSNANYTKHEGKKFDSAGIPLTTRDEGDFYYAVAIAAYGYDLYHAYLTSEDDKQELLTKFLAVADWLKDNCEYTEYGFCSYRTEFEIDTYKLTSGWTTAMGQGQALSVLVAAHYLTGNEDYAQVAFDALSAFLYPLEEKGLTADLDGDTWYEEYGSVEMPNHILNGFLFALSGVYDVKRNYNDSISSHVLNVGINSLVNNIHKFDWHFTSRYSFGPLFQLASTIKGPDAYHELHIFQLAWLYYISGEERIKEYAGKFLAQDMAGIKTMRPFYEQSKKIHDISASSTINSTDFGVDRVFDGYWTIRNYWSSYRFPVDLALSLNEDVKTVGKLDKVVLTSISKQDFPSSFSLIEVTENGAEKILKENISIENTPTFEYSHEVGGYDSYTVTFDVSLPITENTLIIRIFGTDDGIVRLREVDVQYSRSNVLEQIVEFYHDR
mgnify:FL=1